MQDTGDLAVLYAPYAIGQRAAPSRLVAQPMEANDGAESGAPSVRTVTRYVRLAEGGWGLVFLEATAVNPLAVGRLNGLVLTEATAPTFERLVTAFRERNPEALFLVQITHSGRQTHPSLGPVAVCPGLPAGLRYLSDEEIAAIRTEFVQAALLAERVGFDGIDYKLCNGYLGHEILRPANTRADRWGGSFENRARFLVEGIAEIAARRQRAGFLLGARISFYEDRAGGFGTGGPTSQAYDPSEPLELVRVMGQLGMDYVNITGSSRLPPQAAGLGDEERRVATLCFERIVLDLVHAANLGLAVIGGGYSALADQAPALAARRVRHGQAELIGLGRQSLADPLTPAKLRAGEPIDWCTRCGACMRLILDGRPGGCAVHDPLCHDPDR